MPFPFVLEGIALCFVPCRPQGGCDTRRARSVNRHAHVAAIYDQNYFASADAKVCDACLPPCAAAKSATLGCGRAVSRPEGAKCAGGVRAGRCFALGERKMRAYGVQNVRLGGGAETLFCARGAQNACLGGCCFAPVGRERRIFRFDEGEIGNLNDGFLRKMRKKGLPFCAAACYDNSESISA